MEATLTLGASSLMSGQLVPETALTLKVSTLMTALTLAALGSMPGGTLSAKASATQVKKKLKKKEEGETHKKAKSKSKSSGSTPHGQQESLPRDSCPSTSRLSIPPLDLVKKYIPPMEHMHLLIRRVDPLVLNRSASIRSSPVSNQNSLDLT